MDETSLKQKKIALAQSDMAMTIIDLMQDCKTPVVDIIGKTEWETIVNAITLEVEARMMVKMVDYIKKIREGYLHENNG